MAIIRPFTVLIHELGHSLPALIFTKDKVQLFVGSDGDPQKSLHITLGRLELFFKYNPILWNHGLCVHRSGRLSINKNIIITLSGPLTSLLFGISSIYFAFVGDMHGSLKLISVFILVSSLIDFFTNLIPNSIPTILHNGLIVYNDGQQLKQLLSYKTMPAQYNTGIEYYDKTDYKSAAIQFQYILDSGIVDEYIFRLAISSYLQSKDYASALSVHEKFDQEYPLNSDDYSNAAVIKSYLNKYEEGLVDYQIALEKNPKNNITLSNRGYTYLLIGEFRKAITDFNQAIELEPDSAYAYSNRGLAKMKLGHYEDGLKDVNKSLRLDVLNSYAYKNLGIYYFDKGEYETAMVHFEKANQLDKETHLLQEYMLKTENEIGKVGG